MSLVRPPGPVYVTKSVKNILFEITVIDNKKKNNAIVGTSEYSDGKTSKIYEEAVKVMNTRLKLNAARDHYE